MAGKSGADKTLAIVTHILGWVTGFIGPLIVFLIAKDKFTKDNAKNALNWQFSLIIYLILSAILMIVLIGFLMIFVVVVLNVIFSIIAAVKASEGIVWRYPLSIGFFKVE